VSSRPRAGVDRGPGCWGRPARLIGMAPPPAWPSMLGAGMSANCSPTTSWTAALIASAPSSTWPWSKVNRSSG